MLFGFCMRSLLLCALLLACASPVVAQREASSSQGRLYIQGGVGYGGAGAGPNTEAGGHLSGRAAAQLRDGRLAFTARVTTTTGGKSQYSRFAILGPSGVWDGFHDAGLLVGYALPVADRVEVTGSAGAAVVWGTRAAGTGCFSFCLSSGMSEPFTPRLGIPAEVGIAWRIQEAAAVGLVGYANVNTEEPFGGLLFTITAILP